MGTTSGAGWQYLGSEEFTNKNTIGATTSDGLQTENASLGYGSGESYDKKW